jgi:hypothetical protein
MKLLLQKLLELRFFCSLNEVAEKVIITHNMKRNIDKNNKVC